MDHLFANPNAQLALLSIGAGLVVLVAIFVMMSRFYQRCGADEALVRTGAGGNKVVIGGGTLVFPILHQLLRVSLRSIKLSVERAGKHALVTHDKIKANVATELYVKVEPIADDVLAAARSFGERNMNEQVIGDLIEGKLTDALRSVAANSTFMDLHSQRKQFAEAIQNVLAEELSKNGLKLENVSITALAMVPVRELDPSDVFDAEGLRAITDSVQSNNEKTNAIQREKELAVKQQNLAARKAALSMEQDQAQAEADQSRKVSEYAATQQAETAKAVYLQQQQQETAALEKQRAVETSRIAQEQAIAVAQAARQRAEQEAQIAAQKAMQTAEIARQKEIEAATIEKQKTVQTAEVARQKEIEAASIDKQRAIEAAEVAKQQAIETARISKQIAVTQSEEAAARAAALKAQAEAEREQANQAIVTVEATAKARREKEIAVIKSEEEAQQSRIGADREAYRLRLEAETRAAAVKAQAEGEASARKAQAEGEVARAKGSAEAQQVGAETQALVVRTAAQAEADKVRIAAEARAAAAMREAEALIALAEATRKKGEAEAEARQKLVEAENAMSTKFLMRDVALKALDVLPEVAKELMSPAKAISEIKVLQLQGMGSKGGDGAEGSAAGGGFGVASPVLKTVLEAGAAYPLLRELMQFAQVDTGKLADKARGLLNVLPAELKAVLDADPALAAKVEALVKDRPSGAGIEVRNAEDTSESKAAESAPRGA